MQLLTQLRLSLSAWKVFGEPSAGYESQFGTRRNTKSNVDPASPIHVPRNPRAWLQYLILEGRRLTKSIRSFNMFETRLASSDT